jgi:GNAT superfamily N-acetyltransferase
MEQRQGTTDVAIEPVAGLAGGELADFVRIYEAVFPADEREVTEKLVASVNRLRMRCVLARRRGGVCGFAVLLSLGGRAEGIEYLAYLGVDPALQGTGIGSRLLRACAEAGPGPGIVLEIQDPDAAEAANREQRWRRAAFYLRNGAAFVGGAPRYRAPNFSGTGGPLGFRLMWIPGSAAELTGGLLRACVESLLVQGYRLSPGDELVRANLAALVSPATRRTAAYPAPEAWIRR